MTCLHDKCPAVAAVDFQSVLDTLGYHQRVVCANGHSAWEPGPKAADLRVMVEQSRAEARMMRGQHQELRMRGGPRRAKTPSTSGCGHCDRAVDGKCVQHGGLDRRERELQRKRARRQERMTPCRYCLLRAPTRCGFHGGPKREAWRRLNRLSAKSAE